MHYVLEAIDTQLLGQPVVSLHCGAEADDIEAVESQYVRDFDPAYVSCSVPLRDIASLHALQKLGFMLMECQLKTVGDPRRAYDVSSFPYQYQRVAATEALEDVVAIASSVIRYDRFSIDPQIPKWFSGARYEAYVRQSFQSEDDEVWQLTESMSGKIVAFRTCRRLPDGSVRLLLEGVSPLRPSAGLGAIETQFFLSEMYRRQVPSLVAFVSPINMTGFALDITSFGFRLSQAFAVLRKIYKPVLQRSRH